MASPVLTVIKPSIPPNVAGTSVFASGVAFNQYGPPLQPFGLLTGFASIRDNLRNILFFRKGDYPDNPDFGVGIQDYVFDQNDEVLSLALSQEISRQIATYESRVTIRGINISTPAWADDSIAVNLDLLVNNTALVVTAGSNGIFNISQQRVA